MFDPSDTETEETWPAGLSWRTSPDHGTGLDNAGQGVASEGSFRAAVWMACDIHRNREVYKTIGVNPLQPQKREKERKDG